MKKLLCTLLALLTVSPMLIACSGGGNETDTAAADDTTAAAETTAATESEYNRSTAPDSLPDNLDLNGQTVVLYYRDHEITQKAQMEGENNGGDVLYDAVYERNQKVKDRLNVNIEFKKGPADDKYFRLIRDEVQKVVLAGDADWDALFMSAQFGFTQTLLGYYVDLMDFPYIDYDQPWWWSDYMLEESIDATKRYMLNGDLTLYALMSAASAYFNKDMFENINGDPAELYAHVDDGTWTVETFLDYCASAYMDVNGDGSRDEDDIFGVRHTSVFSGVNYLTLSCGIPMHTRDEDGLPVLDIYNDTWIKWNDILVRYMNTDEYSKISKEPDIILDSQYFINQKALFCMSKLSDAEKFRNTDFSYGILPFPKYREEFDYIASGATPNADSIFIPVTTAMDKYDAIGATLEALCAESYRSVTEKYYETTLKGKYLENEDDIRMVDTIYNNIGTNFVMVAGVELGSGAISSMFAYVIRDHQGNLTSYYESKKDSFEKYVEDMINKYDDLEV